MSLKDVKTGVNIAVCVIECRGMCDIIAVINFKFRNCTFFCCSHRFLPSILNIIVIPQLLCLLTSKFLTALHLLSERGSKMPHDVFLVFFSCWDGSDEFDLLELDSSLA